MRVVFELRGKKITGRIAQIIKKLGGGEVRSFHKEELPSMTLQESNVNLRLGDTSFFILKNGEVHAVSGKILGGMQDINSFLEKLRLKKIINEGPLKILERYLNKLSKPLDVLIQAIIYFLAGGLILGILNEPFQKIVGTIITLTTAALFLFRNEIIFRWGMHKYKFEQA